MNGDTSSGRVLGRAMPRLEDPPLLTGRDLIAAGFTPGPEFSRMLDAVEDAQLESRIHSREEALELVKTQFAL